MKKVLLFLSSLLLFTGCSYDDSDLQKRIDDLDEKLAELAARVDALNSDLTSLRELIDGKRFISDVTVDEDGSYTLTLVTSTGAISTIRITNGEDGHSPKIGIKQDSDGKYYWTSTASTSSTATTRNSPLRERTARRRSSRSSRVTGTSPTTTAPAGRSAARLRPMTSRACSSP